jgi:hypothetical protein
MSRRDRTPLPPDVARELAALDAALTGDPVDPDLADLAALAVQVRDARPRPDAGVVARLDERAAAGFAPRPSAPPARSRRRLAVPLAAATLAVAGIALVAVLGNGGDDQAGIVATAPPSAQTTTGDVVAKDRATPSQSSAQSESSAAPPVAAPKAQQAPGASAAPVTPSPVAPARSVERGAGLHLAALPGGLDDVASGIVRTTDALGGYVVSSSVESRGSGGSATFDLRVPAARLQTALARLSGLARVRSRTQSSLDVTGSVVAVRTRLDALQAERGGVLRQLAAAATPADTAKARARIRVLDVRIARAQAARAALHRRTAYSTIDVEVTTQRPAAGAATGTRGSWTPGDALRDAVRVLSVALGVALVALAALLPLGLLAAAGFGAWRLTVARSRRHALDPAN